MTETQLDRDRRRRDEHHTAMANRLSNHISVCNACSIPIYDVTGYSGLRITLSVEPQHRSRVPGYITAITDGRFHVKWASNRTDPDLPRYRPHFCITKDHE